jgi:hypothetical protein
MTNGRQGQVYAQVVHYWGLGDMCCSSLAIITQILKVIHKTIHRSYPQLWISVGTDVATVDERDNWQRLLHGPRLGFDPTGEVGYLVVQAPTLSHQLPDFPIRMHNGGVITATKSLANFRQGKISEFPTEVH